MATASDRRPPSSAAGANESSEGRSDPAAALSLRRLRRAYATLLGRLEPGLESVPLRTTPSHDGAPHIERRDGRWFYLVTERGHLLESRSTADRTELLFWLISDASFGLAVDYELHHRVAGQDARRILFARRLELLKRVNPDWAARVRDEIDEILHKHPYHDGTNPATDLE